MPLSGPELTLSAYVNVLQVLYPLLAGWEAWSAAVAPPSLVELLRERRRSHWLAEDLRALGAAEEMGQGGVDWQEVVAPRTCRDGTEPWVEGPVFEASLLGAIYVMEGSTLGGRFIARQVESSLGITPGVGDVYFRGHGDATGRMWREVSARIEAVPNEYSELVVAAARRTFGAFGRALRAGNPAPETMQNGR